MLIILKRCLQLNSKVFYTMQSTNFLHQSANKNELSNLISSSKVSKFIEKYAQICQPKNIHVCDGSESESKMLFDEMQKLGMVKRLKKYQNCWLVRTDPKDVARVESKTFISTHDRNTTVATTAESVPSCLGNWISPADLSQALWKDRFPGCMKGRTMYVIPFSMGPIGSKFSKIGIELTDSPYVVESMKIMTRVGNDVLEALAEDSFVKCLHSVGQPLPLSAEVTNNWPCNPAKVLISHIPEENFIVSFGSGYGGNSLLGKKCLSLRLGSILGKKEGWLAEHMLILCITNEKGVSKFFVAAFPSGCGKTNLAMMMPKLPGYKVECIGDDIAWIRFGKDGQLRAINPENGFFGIAPGTSSKSNPIAMDMVLKDTIFTNVAETSDGGVFWEGLEKDTSPRVRITSWEGVENWEKNKRAPAAHPNSRFCTPLTNCSILHEDWQNPEGVPISGIIFGGRRSTSVPLCYESFNWEHGVFIGSCMRSEATSAAEHKQKTLMHDPFAMRPFFGYNFGEYLSHWLSLKNKTSCNKLPKIFHVNWFRKAGDEYLWPGFGENIRVLDWIFRRCDNEDIQENSPIGYIPKSDSINYQGLQDVNHDSLFSIPRQDWLKECDVIEKFFKDQIPHDCPQKILEELANLRERLSSHQV